MSFNEKLVIRSISDLYRIYLMQLAVKSDADTSGWLGMVLAKLHSLWEHNQNLQDLGVPVTG